MDSKTIGAIVVVVVVGAIASLIFFNSKGSTTVDPTQQTHGGTGSTLLCIIYPPACVKK